MRSPGRYLVRHGAGFKFQMAVPRDLRAIVGRRMWRRYLGGLSEPEARLAALQLSVAYRREVDRLRAHLSGVGAASLIADPPRLSPEPDDVGLPLPPVGKSLKRPHGVAMTGGASAVWVAPSGGVGACGLPFSDNRGVVGAAGFQPRACNDNAGDVDDGDDLVLIARFRTEPRFSEIEVREEMSLGADGLGPAVTSNPRGIRSSDDAVERGIGDCLDDPGDCIPPDDGVEPTTILDLVELWREIARPRAKRSYLRMVTCAKLLNEVVGPLPPQSINRSHIMRLRDHLETTDLSRATARLYLQGIHRLFSVALSEGRTSENPARGIQLRAGTDKFVDRDRRRPFDHAELRAIEGALQSEPMAFRWVVRLLAYHGMRSGEAVQLHVEDVVSLFGVPVLRVHDRHGSIKNRFSQRDIPLHPACHGFLEYAQRQGGGRIFPVDTWRADRFQRFAGVFLRKRAGITETSVTMHSLRHTWRTLAREIAMPAPVSRAIMGHSMGSDIHEGYGAGPSLRLQAEWIGRIDPFVPPQLG